MSMVLVNKKTLFSNQNTTSEDKPTKTENNKKCGKMQRNTRDAPRKSKVKYKTNQKKENVQYRIKRTKRDGINKRRKKTQTVNTVLRQKTFFYWTKTN